MTDTTTDAILTVLVCWAAIGFIGCAIYGMIRGGRK